MTAKKKAARTTKSYAAALKPAPKKKTAKPRDEWEEIDAENGFVVSMEYTGED